jgi:uracil-DNA glycosylase
MKFLQAEKEKSYYKELKCKYEKDIEKWGKHRIYPPKDKIFRAYEITKFNDVKVVIIG